MSVLRPLTALIWTTRHLLKFSHFRNLQTNRPRRNQSSSAVSANANLSANRNSQNQIDQDVKCDPDPDLELDDDLIRHLERTSLVDFESEEALVRLKEAIQFANTILDVDTEGIEPMASVLEDTPLRLREDKAVKMNRADILLNASVTEEDYFVSPPGNIPLEPKNKRFPKVSNSSSNTL